MQPDPCHLRRAQPWLGTLVEIRADASRSTRWTLMAAIDAAFAEIAAIHRLLSRQARGADLVAIEGTAAGRSVRVDPRTAEVLQLALELRDQSGGRFDPDRRARSRERDDSASTASAWIVEGRDRVRALRHGELDLDGIAKGYAVDRAVGILEREGISAVVNAGGDLRCSGMQGEPLLIRSALLPGALVEVGRLGAGSFATSNSWIDAAAAPALASEGIHDPRHRRRQLPRMTVGVAAERCAVADGLTKVVAVDPVASESVLALHRARAWILEANDGSPTLRHAGAFPGVLLDAA